MLKAVLGSRLKIIGREVRILMQTYPLLLRALDPSTAVVDAGLTAEIRTQQIVLDDMAKKLEELSEKRDGQETLDAALKEYEELMDELDFKIEDQRRVREGELALVPELADYMLYWESLVAALKPWVAPPATHAAKMEALEGNQVRVDEFFRHHRRLGFSVKSSYYHGLEAHSTERLEYFKKNLIGIDTPTDLHCQVQEHVNKLIKSEMGPMIGKLHVPDRNTFFHVMREWQVRLRHFPDTIHVRRIEKCGACGIMGHRKTSRICEKYPDYVAARRATDDLWREAAVAKATEVAQRTN